MAGSLTNIQAYRVSVFNSIHEILFHGQGGYDYDTVYNMPIWLRKFTFNKLKDWYNKKNEKKESQANQIDMVNPDKSKIPTRPTINPPTYITKASKK